MLESFEDAKEEDDMPQRNISATKSTSNAPVGVVLPLRSPNIRRSELTGQYVVETTREREARKKKAISMGLGWYV